VEFGDQEFSRSRA